MSIYGPGRATIYLCLLVLSSTCLGQDKSDFEGTWRVTSYYTPETQTRYQTEGYMMFGKAHWLHVMFLNRDERSHDFSEAHHGTYEITAPGTFSLGVDMELHMDPKTEMQETPVWYGAAENLQGATYQLEGKQLILDLPSTTQLVLEKVE